jgi:hypothetical protein
MSGLLSIVTPAFAAFPKALGRGRIAYVTLYGALQQNDDTWPRKARPSHAKNACLAISYRTIFAQHKSSMSGADLQAAHMLLGLARRPY